MRKATTRWTIVFRALANPNRLEIIENLSSGRRMAVGDLADTLKISITSTSNHLAILKNLEVVESRGVSGHVYYSLNSSLPQDFKKAILLFTRR